MKKKAIAYKPPVHKKLQIKHMLYKKKEEKKRKNFWPKYKMRTLPVLGDQSVLCWSPSLRQLLYIPRLMTLCSVTHWAATQTYRIGQKALELAIYLH